MSASALPIPPTTERITLADAAQDVVESAHYSNECYVTVNRIDGLEACIPEARAIEAATRAAINAYRRLQSLIDVADDRERVPTMKAWGDIVCCAGGTRVTMETLAKLIGVPS